MIALAKRNELPQPVRAALHEVFSSPGPIVEWQFLGPWRKSAQPQFDTTRAPILKQLAGRPIEGAFAQMAAAENG